VEGRAGGIGWDDLPRRIGRHDRHGAGVQRETLSEQVVRRLMEWMADQGLQPGDRLPAELQLAKSFGSVDR